MRKGWINVQKDIDYGRWEDEDDRQNNDAHEGYCEDLLGFLPFSLMVSSQ